MKQEQFVGTQKKNQSAMSGSKRRGASLQSQMKPAHREATVRDVWGRPTLREHQTHEPDEHVGACFQHLLEEEEKWQAAGAAETERTK